LAYGSHVSRPPAGESDLDLLFVGPPLPAGQLDDLAAAVVALHQAHRLRLDTEVAYQVKLHATPAQVDAAVGLQGFTVDPRGDLDIAPVVAAPWFLNSLPFKLRLILNALTTPHVFLGGNICQYERLCASADTAVALVALSLLAPADSVTVADVVTALVTGADGSAGKDFLGYRRGPALYATVHRGLTRLTTHRVVRPVDGVRYAQHHARRRAVVAALNRDGMISRWLGECTPGTEGGPTLD